MNNNDTLITLDEKMRAELCKKQLEILQLFVSLCEKHKLTYFIAGGSALGTVRHGGYIPWDDDIDIAMPRKDYSKLLEVAKDELPDGFFLQCHKTDPDYRNDFSKIRNSNTVFLEASAAKLNINHGIYIDIFPIDGYPTKKITQNLLEIFKTIAKAYLGKDYIVNKNSSKRKILIAISKIIFIGKKPADVINMLESKYIKYTFEDSDKVICHGGAWGKSELGPKEYYGPGVDAYFEGIKIKIPEQIDAYLTHKYGDYMQLPPPEKRIAHHYCLKVDFDHSLDKI